MPMYGALSLDRIPVAVWSFVAAIVPLSRGAGLPRPAGAMLTPARLLTQLAFTGTAVTLAAGAFWLSLRRKRIWRGHGEVVLLCAAWLTVRVPANIWLEPGNPEHWITPLVPVLILVAAGYDAWLSGKSTGSARRIGWLCGSAVLVVTLANLTQAIWPDHHRPNPDILMAQCVAAQMGDDDLVVSPMWDWTLYMPAEAKRHLSLPEFSLSRVGRYPNSQRLLSQLDSVIADIETGGGRALLVDVLAYEPGQWTWIETNLGLRLEEVHSYRLELAFVCRGERVWRIAGREPSSA